MLIQLKKNLIYLLLKSFLFNYVFKDLKYILITCFQNRINSTYSLNIIFLPKRIKKFSVVRSPTMSKLSKEQFEFITYKLCLLVEIHKDLLYIFYKSQLLKTELAFSYLRVILINK